MEHGRGGHLIELFLQPGEYFVGDAGFRVRTLLGSCVSITLWHPLRRVGAMSHFLLARRHDGRPGKLDARYGEEAMLLMAQQLGRIGVDLRQCQAKIFGGADMFPQHPRGLAPKVGRDNGEGARSLLRKHGVEIVSESLFGVGHRQIFFDIRNGDVWARQVPLLDAPQPGGARR